MRGLLSTILVLVLAACASPAERVVPPAQETAPGALEASRSLAGAPAGEWPAERWWTAFEDPQLDALIDQALVASPTLAIASARIRRAQALVEAAVAKGGYDLTGALDVTHQRFTETGIYPPPIAGSTRTTAQLTVNFNYELDYAHRNDAAIAAAHAVAFAAGADAYAARLALASGVARAYFQLQGLFALREVDRSELAQREQLVELTRRRVAAGLDTEAQLASAEAAPPVLRAQIAKLDGAIALARNQIAALAGKGPDRGLALEPAAARDAGPGVPQSLPLDLLGRRPDLAAARWRAQAAARSVEVAKAQFMPNVNLVAFAGLSSLGLDKLLQARSTIVGAGPAVRLPLFSAGGLQANLRGREAEYDLAVEQYNLLLVDAVREVADQVQARRAIENEGRELKTALAAVQRAYDLALERYRAGVSNLLSVLDAQRALFTEQRAAADLRARALQADVGLYRALGGGYQDHGLDNKTDHRSNK
ncbi:MAG TPA: efflux transporter outer membrane subunit [Burkholderiales bacterium]|nr:efflux transporter outer membrane subunit [Burkholderiales bacterium]